MYAQVKIYNSVNKDLDNKSPQAKNPLTDSDFQGSSGFTQVYKLD